MLLPDLSTQRSLKNLSEVPDFIEVLRWIVRSKESDLNDLVSAQDALHLHRLQGSAQALEDVLQAAMSANPSLSTHLGRRVLSANTRSLHWTEPDLKDRIAAWEQAGMRGAGLKE